MKEYIDLNINMRSKSKSKFEKDFYKLINNSLFRKTMEKVRNRCDIKLENKKYSQKFSKIPNFKTFKIFDDDCIASHMIKKVMFNKPIYIF